MPTYQYLCDYCDVIFEIERHMMDKTSVICPQCGGSTHRVFTAPSVHYHGSGFFTSDNRQNALKIKPSRDLIKDD
jgi:putative FmdB family regulatory protein